MMVKQKTTEFTTVAGGKGFFFKVSETVFLIRGLQFSSLDLQGAPVDLVKNAIDIHGIDRLSRSMAVPESQQS
jgi:hypothetical protein